MVGQNDRRVAPRGVTFISWMVIITAVCRLIRASRFFWQSISVLNKLSQEGYELPESTLRVSAWLGLAWAVTYGLVHVVAGVYMLKARGWSRILLLCSIPVHVAVYWHLYGLRLAVIALGVIYVALAVYLFTGAASRYFRGETAKAHAE